MLNLPLYFDHSATTPVDARVMEAMRPYFTEMFGNASSASHAFGQRARQAVETARRQVAKLINASAAEIIFTSGATESDNLAIKGVAMGCAGRGRHIVTQVTEHKAVIDPCRRLEREGFEVTWLSVDERGRISPRQVREAIRRDTILVTLMTANNETGTIQPIREIGAICRERGVLFHTDATQAVGKIAVDARDVDLLSVSAHKLYGPKGAGALYVRGEEAKAGLRPLIDGGGQESGLRAGTLNVPGIVGLGAACEIAAAEMEAESMRLRALRDRLERGIRDSATDVLVNGDEENRLPHVTNLSFADVDGTWLLKVVNAEIACSSGAACSSAKIEPSYVLRAMGRPVELALAALRLSLGRGSDEEQVDYAVKKIARSVSQLRRLGGCTLECGRACVCD